jgi:hypothetical protein
MLGTSMGKWVFGTQLVQFPLSGTKSTTGVVAKIVLAEFFEELKFSKNSLDHASSLSCQDQHPPIFWLPGMMEWARSGQTWLS